MADFVEISIEMVQDPEMAFQFFVKCEEKRKNKFLQLYLQQVFKGSIVFEKCVILLRHIMVNESSFSLLLEQLYLYSQIVHNQDGRRLYKQLLHQLCERAPAQLRQQLLDYLDEETLSEVGLLNAEAFQRRKRQLNTQLNFVQSKFSLMRDENEGFAKIAVEITEASREVSATDACISNILSLIGYFDLDPDRVVDLVLESWLGAPLRFSHLDILKRFKHTSIAHFLGKRFELVLSSTGNTAQTLGIQATIIENAYQSILTDPRVPPYSLVLVTALSIKYKLFDIPLIWEYLSPNDQLMERCNTDKCESAFKFYKNFDQLRTAEELNDIDNRTERMRKEVFDQFLYNQKAWLMQGLLAVNAFDQFKRLHFTMGAMLDYTNFTPLKVTFADFISWAIQPLYQSISYSKHFSQRPPVVGREFPCDPQRMNEVQPFTALDETFIVWLEDVLSIFRCYAGEFPILMMKLLRILIEIPNKQLSDRIESIVMRLLMPAMSSRDSLPIAKVLWKYIQNIDYRKRYAYYSEWKDNQQFQTFLQIVRTGDLAKSHLRGVFNKLDKDNKDKMMMRLAKLSHSQPILVMNELRRDRVQNSDNNPFMVHALGMVTGLGLDILTFSLVQWLNDFNDETKVRARDIECSLWYRNTAAFMGAFYRKYFHVEMQGLFVHICDGLASTHEIKPELLVLRELIEKMTGIVQIEDLSGDQVQALAGGRYIQLETTHQTNDYKKSRKSNQALENFFWNTTINSCRLINQVGEEEEVSLAFLLLIILSQQRTKFLKHYNDQNLRPLSNVYDNFTWSINQLTKCLLFQTDKPTHYAQLFPKNPLQRLVLDFKIPFEVAFRVVRYGHKSLYNMSETEFLEMRDNIKSIYDHADPLVMYDNPMCEETPALPNIAHTLVKDKLWDNVSPDLFAIFWLLSVDNIYVPTSVYEKQVKAQQENMLKITDPKELARFQKTSSKAMEKLQSELDNNRKRKEQFDKFLVDKKECLKFKDDDVETFTQVLSQLCILPRILIDPSEAMYCAKFVHTLIRISKSKYTNTFYIPRDIIYYTLSFLQCATEQESVNLSIFVVLLLQPFANWNDEGKYKQDFKTYFDGCDEQTQGKPQAYERQKQFIVATIFLRIFQFLKLLKNNDTQVRNAMIFLKNTQDIFPPTQQIAKLLKEYLSEVQELYGDIQDIRVRISTYRLTDRIPLLPDYICKNLSPTTPKVSERPSDRPSDRPIEHREKERERTEVPRERGDRSDRERNERERGERVDHREVRERGERGRETAEKESKDRNEGDRKKESKKTHERNERKEDKVDPNNFNQSQGLRKMPKK